MLQKKKLILMIEYNVASVKEKEGEIWADLFLYVANSSKIWY